MSGSKRSVNAGRYVFKVRRLIMSNDLSRVTYVRPRTQRWPQPTSLHRKCNSPFIKAFHSLLKVFVDSSVVKIRIKNNVVVYLT